jgi:hypothetical protein
MAKNCVRRVWICRGAVTEGTAADGVINWKGCGQAWPNQCHKQLFYLSDRKTANDRNVYPVDIQSGHPPHISQQRHQTLRLWKGV